MDWRWSAIGYQWRCPAVAPPRHRNGRRVILSYHKKDWIGNVERTCHCFLINSTLNPISSPLPLSQMYAATVGAKASARALRGTIKKGTEGGVADQVPFL